MKSILSFILASAGVAFVPFWFNTDYSRNDYQWHLANSGEPDILYFNGVPQSTNSGGAYDLHWKEINCAEIRVGVITDTLPRDMAFQCGIIFGGAGLQGIASGAVADGQQIGRAHV